MSDKDPQGFVELLSATEIRGWAHDPVCPDKPAAITLFIDDRWVATLLADGFRPDLQAAGFGNGKRAFRFDPGPYLSLAEKSIRIAFARTGATVPHGRSRLARDPLPSGQDWDTLVVPSEKRSARSILESVPTERWPLISVLVPSYNIGPRFLEPAVRSVLAQTYPRWELCIVDDCSTQPEVIEYLRSIAGTNPAIKVALRDTNGGISAATNQALGLAGGDYCALLDADDLLTPDALEQMAAHLVAHPTTDVVFSDQDKCDEAGHRFEPFHKPAWSPVFFLGVMYVGHLLVVRTSLLRKVGGCNSRFDKVQDYELMLRLSEVTDRIAHLPLILYHWRTLPGSLASSSAAKNSIGELQAAAVREHLRRCQIAADVAPHPTIPHRAQLLPQPRQTNPRVSILMPSACNLKFLAQAVACIFGRSTYANIELVLIINEIRWQVPEQAAFLEEVARNPRVKIIRYPDQPYNFSLYNNWAAQAASGEILVLCNDDIEVVTPDWIERMLMHLELPGVAAVGPLLTYPNNQVQHAGVVLGFRGTADHVMRGFDPASDGYAGSLSCSREVEAVTAACLMLRKRHYWEIGGMREALATIYNDVDLCLRLRNRGYSILYAANVHLIHHESVSRGSYYDPLERALFLDAYGGDLRRGDRYYNRHFTRNSPDYRLRLA